VVAPCRCCSSIVTNCFWNGESTGRSSLCLPASQRKLKNWRQWLWLQKLICWVFLLIISLSCCQKQVSEFSTAFLPASW